MKYPDDLRNHRAVKATHIQRVKGHKLMVIWSDWAMDQRMIYRFDGEIAVPAVWISRMGGHPSSWRPPHFPPELLDRAWMWVDGDGDGQFDAGEYAAVADGELSGFPAMHVDEAGSLWLAEVGRSRDGVAFNRGRVHRFRLPATDSAVRGVPQYSASRHDVVSVADLPGGPPWEGVERLWYDADDDVMYLAGYLDADPAVSEKDDPPFRQVRRYDRWSNRPTVAWTRTDLPFRTTGSFVQGFRPSNLEVDRDNDYVFLGYFRRAKDGGGRPDILVLRATDGSTVGVIRPDPQVATSGDLDFCNAMNVHKRADGTYVVFLEDDAYSKITVLQWRPAGSRR